MSPATLAARAPLSFPAPSGALSNAFLRHAPRTVQAALPAYDRSRVTPGIAHIGVGNFHRVHQALAIDRCLHLPDHASWGIVGIGLGDGAAARAKADAYRRQDGLYSVTAFDAAGGADARVVGAMVDYLHAPRDPDAVLRLLASPAIRIVSLTITEGGYNIDETSGAFRLDEPAVARDLAAAGMEGGAAPRTAFGLIVGALRLRRAAGLPAFTVLSCDNLRANGDTARHAVLSYAYALDRELADWIACHAAFPNSMVDRIAPGVSDQQRRRIAALLGAEDALPAVAEPFSQWVVEDRFSAGRPDLAAAGVVFSDEVHAWEALKGRMLNASHMLLAYPALLCGYRTVPEAMRDPLLKRLLVRFMEADVIPHLDLPQGVSAHAYKETLLKRFANPAVADQLLRVAHDGAAKIPVFHSKTIATLLERGADPARPAFLLACFRRYLSGRDCNGGLLDVAEPHFSDIDDALLDPADPLTLLDTSPFAALGLRRQPAFVDAYLRLADAIEAHGIRIALATVATTPAPAMRA
ncbi:mannitol dehydrogenase family protein [uncultured Massilia sp.]|uniref:mannitol dehydrogenase family protein n=1 Tax=uncultured Massilia sp. TaxID=169973 RepID=UPI0025DDA3E0|nr:mannitol dehydrogenase family protein [uncultured Massilia sp.]